MTGSPTWSARLAARHDVMWAMVSDMPAVGGRPIDGYDVATGDFVLSGSGWARAWSAAYRRAEQQRRQRLDDVPDRARHSARDHRRQRQIRPGLVEMAEVFARAG